MGIVIASMLTKEARPLPHIPMIAGQAFDWIICCLITPRTGKALAPVGPVMSEVADGAGMTAVAFNIGVIIPCVVAIELGDSIIADNGHCFDRDAE